MGRNHGDNRPHPFLELSIISNLSVQIPAATGVSLTLEGQLTVKEQS